MMKKILIIISFSLLNSFVNSQQSNDVTIGSQIWMTNNLDVTTFRNGDPIPQARTDEEWEMAAQKMQPAWCYYDDNPYLSPENGKLYNWYAVNDSRGLAPVGYHIPTDTEWTVLVDYLGGEEVAGKKLKSTMKWPDLRGNPANENNESGFSGRPAGEREVSGSFGYINYNCFWWSASIGGNYSAYYRILYHNRLSIGREMSFKGHGYSVRCLRD
jgi:uncharacterized protein (TIGR02145 family)